MRTTPVKNVKQDSNKLIHPKLLRFGDKRHTFQKGKSGNPHGRPPVKSCIPDLLRAIGDKPVDPWLLAKLRKQYGPAHTPSNMREAMLMSTYVDASQGDNVARVFIAERTEGKVPQAQINLNQNTDDLSKMPLSDIIALASDIAEDNQTK